jgi:hypothetical protein
VVQGAGEEEQDGAHQKPKRLQLDAAAPGSWSLS